MNAESEVMPAYRKEIWNSLLHPAMKPDSDSKKKSDSDSVTPIVTDGEGIDAFRILQIVGGIICAMFVVWIIFHSFLHII